MYIFRLYTRKMALYHSSIVCTKLSFVKKNLLILKMAKSNTKKFYEFFFQKLRIYLIKKSCKSTPYQMKQDWIFYIINFFQLRLSFSYSFIHSFISFFIPVGPHPSLKMFTGVIWSSIMTKGGMVEKYGNTYILLWLINY